MPSAQNTQTNVKTSVWNPLEGRYRINVVAIGADLSKQYSAFRSNDRRDWSTARVNQSDKGSGEA